MQPATSRWRRCCATIVSAFYLFAFLGFCLSKPVGPKWKDFRTSFQSLRLAAFHYHVRRWTATEKPKKKLEMIENLRQGVARERAQIRQLLDIYSTFFVRRNEFISPAHDVTKCSPVSIWDDSRDDDVGMAIERRSVIAWLLGENVEQTLEVKILGWL